MCVWGAGAEEQQPRRSVNYLLAYERTRRSGKGRVKRSVSDCFQPHTQAVKDERKEINEIDYRVRSSTRMGEVAAVLTPVSVVPSELCRPWWPPSVVWSSMTDFVFVLSRTV